MDCVVLGRAVEKEWRIHSLFAASFVEQKKKEGGEDMLFFCGFFQEQKKKKNETFGDSQCHL